MDLIDRSEAQYKMIEILPEADSLEWYEQARPDEVKDLVDELYNIVLNVNRIDAQPVKHGVWIPNTSLPGQTGFHCSECMFTDKGTYSRRFKRYKRCPNCGAYMGGDADADS